MSIKIDAAKLFQLLDANNDGTITKADADIYKKQNWYASLNDADKAIVDKAVSAAESFDALHSRGATIQKKVMDDSNKGYHFVDFTPITSEGGTAGVTLDELEEALKLTANGLANTRVSTDKSSFASGLNATQLASLSQVWSKISNEKTAPVVGKLAAVAGNPNIDSILKLLDATPPDTKAAAVMIFLGNMGVKTPMDSITFAATQTAIQTAFLANPTIFKDLPDSAKALFFKGAVVDLSAMKSVDILFKESKVKTAGEAAVGAEDDQPTEVKLTAQSVLTAGTLTANATNPHRQRIADYLNASPQQKYLAEILIKLGNDPETANLKLSNMSPADFASLKAVVEAKIAKDPNYLNDLSAEAKKFLSLNGKVDLTTLQQHPDFMAKIVPPTPVTVLGVTLDPSNPYYKLALELKFNNNEVAAAFVMTFGRLMGDVPMTPDNLLAFGSKLSAAEIAAMPKGLKDAILVDGIFNQGKAGQLTLKIQQAQSEFETMKSYATQGELALAQTRQRNLLAELRALLDSIKA